MAKTLSETNIKKKNIALVNVIHSGLKDLKKQITNTSEENKEIENPDKIIDLVEEIIVFNKKNAIKTRTKDFNTRPNA